MLNDLFLVGRVARAHGNKGHVIVNLETDFAEERFRAGHTLWVGPEAHPEPRRIREARFHHRRPVIALEGVDSMNAAEALAGADLWMRADDIAGLPAGTYYHHDLVGCEVVDAQGHRIGIVAGVQGPMEQSRLVVNGGRGEVLIPMASEICVEVDVAAKRIVVNPLEGLLDLNAADSTGRG